MKKDYGVEVVVNKCDLENFRDFLVMKQEKKLKIREFDIKKDAKVVFNKLNKAG